MTRLTIILVSAAALGVMGGLGVWKVYQAGRASARVETLEKAVDLVQERDRLNVKVRNATADDICRRLGGVVLENGECG